MDFLFSVALSCASYANLLRVVIMKFNSFKIKKEVIPLPCDE